MTTQIYNPAPVKKLIDTIVPKAAVPGITNPVVIKLIQLAQFPFICSPQSAGIKVRESFGNMGAHELLEHVSQAERWVIEHLIAYIEGELPVWLRKGLYVIRALLMQAYAAQLLANLLILRAILEYEVLLMDIAAAESLIMSAHAALSATGGRQWERDLITVTQQAQAGINQFVSEKHANIGCI